MKRLVLNALTLSVLAGASVAAYSANFKPNIVASPHNQPTVAVTQTASNVLTPTPTTTPVIAIATASPALGTASQAAAPAASMASTSPAPASAATSAANAATATAPAMTATIAMPTRGMSMAEVERKFGKPLEKLPAVPQPGTKLHPPITRWMYPTYVVYFEYNYVVHSVLKAHPFSSPGTDTN